MASPRAVSELLSSDVETVGPAAFLRAVTEYLYGTGVGSVVVTDEHDVPVGIITGRDIGRAAAEGLGFDTTRVREVMTDSPVTVAPETTGQQAAETMREHGIRHLLVVDDDGLVGVVTATDLAYATPDAPAAESVEVDVDARDRYDERDWAFDGPAGSALSVGDEFTFAKTLTETDIEQFAEATGDTNPLHLDAEYAGATRFGGRIAHGVLTTGVVSAAVARLPGMPIYLEQNARFTAPVHGGERVTATIEVIEEETTDQFRLSTVVTDEDGEIVLDGDALVLVEAEP
ncbi:CBS domain-containing protein [Halosegnis longus]|uniref:CBS domain-containing protein n=1 Tax=Halosegnis longus TaxID=2216012 RepID=UPI00129D5827|nr:CBS domain-containing protein [Halosegnis longus]